MNRLHRTLALGLGLAMLLAACQRDVSMTTVTDSPVTATATPAPVRGEERATEESIPQATEGGTAAATATRDEAETPGIVYQVPFEVQPDGFSFPNYGLGYPEGAFTITDLRAQFGDGVCSRVAVDGEECIPSAEAQLWIDDRNADMRSGHCIGFTVTSYQFAKGDLQPSSFSPSAVVPYDLEQQVPIMRTIAANGSLYWVKSVWSSEVQGTPREILDDLIAMAEPVDLSIYLPGLAGGHSMLAYGVEQVGPEAYHILVYDNNFPGELKFVEVDYAANTWRYAQGAVNPNDTAIPYEGDATTQTLRYIPLTAYDNVTCPFCPAEEEVDSRPEDIVLVSLLGQGDVLVKTALGVISSVAGELLNEIRGASFIPQRGQLAGTDIPDIALPAGIDYTIEFTGLERVSSLGSDFSVVVDQLIPESGDNSLAVMAETNGIEFVAGGAQSPLLNAIIREDGASYSVAILGIDFEEGESLQIGAAENGEGLELRPQRLDVKDATLLVTRLTAEDEAVFASTKLSITDGAGVAIGIADWDGTGGIDLYSDSNGDGVYTDPPTNLPNEPLTDVLTESDASEIAAIIGNLAPYVGGTGIESILDSLNAEELSGREIGLILQKLDLTNEQLVRVVSQLDLDVRQLGDLLFGLRLDAERLDDVIAGLELEAEEESELRAYLQDLALYHEILVSWRFLDSNDMEQLAALLSEYDLTVDQLAQLLPQFELSASELALLLAELDLPAEDEEYLSEQLGVDLIGQGTDRSSGVKPSDTITTTATPTGTSVTTTPSATGTVTATPTPTVPGTPSGTPTPDSYPGAPPPPTRTPSAYPYPGPMPSPSPTPVPYPGAGATPSPAFESTAFCEGESLRIVAKEPTWKDISIEIWLGEEQLVTGTIGPNGEPFETTLPGPRTWTGLVIKAPVEPMTVAFNTISCPQR